MQNASAKTPPAAKRVRLHMSVCASCATHVLNEEKNSSASFIFILCKLLLNPGETSPASPALRGRRNQVKRAARGEGSDQPDGLDWKALRAYGFTYENERDRNLPQDPATQ